MQRRDARGGSVAAPTVLQTFPSPPETHAHRRVAVATLRVRGPLRLPARREAPHLVTQNPASRPRRWAGAFAPSRHVCVTSVPASQEWWDPAPIRKNARPLCVTVRPRCMDLAKRPDAQSRPCPWRTLAPLPVRGSPGARASASPERLAGLKVRAAQQRSTEPSFIFSGGGGEARKRRFSQGLGEIGHRPAAFISIGCHACLVNCVLFGP